MRTTFAFLLALGLAATGLAACDDGEDDVEDAVEEAGDAAEDAVD